MAGSRDESCVLYRADGQISAVIVIAKKNNCGIFARNNSEAVFYFRAIFFGKLNKQFWGNFMESFISLKIISELYYCR